MTAVAESTKRISTSDQYEILRRYATGADLNDIAKERRIGSDYVSGVVSTLTGFNRQFARTLVHNWERERAPKFIEAPKPPEPAVVQPRVVDKPVRAAVAVKAAPIASAAETAATVRAGALIDQAATSGDPQLERLAEKARTLMVDISQRLEHLTAQRAAREKVARLESELAKARAELARHQPARGHATNNGRAAEIRAWCRTNGVEVNPHGRINAEALAAYDSAHGGSDG